MIDVPCGDANWQFESWETDSLTVYVGLDIAPEVISLVKRRFAHHSNKIFAVWDVTRCVLPIIQRQGHNSTADVVQVRDLLQHLSLAHATAATRTILSHRPGFVIATTYPRNETNRRWSAYGASRNPNLTWRQDSSDGDGKWTPFDMQAPPFDFPAPTKCLSAHGLRDSQHDYDLVCLYRMHDSFLNAWLQMH